MVSKCLLYTLFVVMSVLAMTSVATLIAGVTLRQYPIDYVSLPNFKNASCTPVEVTTIKFENCFVTTDSESSAVTYSSEWIAVWKCQETNASVVEDPFSAVSSQTVADNSNHDYPLGVTQDVYCNKVTLPSSYPNVLNYSQCQVWNACFFDGPMIIDLQANAQNRYDQGLHLLFASAGLFAGAVIILAICLICVCCCNKHDTL
jgi:hypothetical protein